ncbi:MAG: autotransporter outer membrane beta-barrel domain-containing protein [Betaproteobacteria bacterium]
MRSHRVPLAAAALAIAFGAGDAFAQFDDIVIFGDSSVDAGFFNGARFTVNPGLVFPQVLGQRYGIAVTSVSQGGHDYAAGGARVALVPGYPAFPPTGSAPPLTTQLDTFLAGRSSLDRNAIYIVSIGYNDIFTNLEAAALGQITADQAQAAIAQAAIQAGQQMARLTAAGARYVVVPNLYDLGVSPGGRANPTAPLTAVSSLFNTTLATTLAQAGGEYVLVNTRLLFDEVLANPEAYGFHNVTQPACTVPASLLCSGATLVSPDAAQTYLFADSAHFTPGAYAITADAVASMLEGPAKIGVLAEAPLAVERATFRAIDGRMISALDAPASGSRFEGWVSYDYGRNDFDGHFVSGNADVNTVAAGFDVKVSEPLLVGAAASYADNRGDFGASSGGYTLKETTGTLYAGYGGGPWYVGATLGAGDLDFSDVHRDFDLGPASRSERSEPRGWHAMASVLGGYWFDYASVLHGPFVRLAYQKIRVKSFTEQSGDSTALAFGEQTRKSLVSRLGWQASGQIGRVRPFARIAWDHEGEDDARFVSASSATLGGSYAVPTVQPDSSYVEYLLGASTEFGKITAYVMGSATSGRSDGDAYGITVGVRAPL